LTLSHSVFDVLAFLASWLLGFLASWLLGFLASWLLGFLALLGQVLGFLGLLAAFLAAFCRCKKNVDTQSVAHV
jgi:hypothetical protein